MSIQLPPCPPSLKPIQHYLKTASEHDGRDPVIGYWCRLYALQTALKIDKKSDEAKMMLMGLMDWLEKEKKRLKDDESITNDVAAQAHIENYALKLFLWADSQDRAGQFNKNVVKAFYTAGFLMDVLGTFGEQTEEVQQNCKYAKWKAAYIHNCLKNGEMPVAGPLPDQSDPGLPGSEFSQPNIGFENINRPDVPAPSSSETSFPGPASSNQFPTPPASSSPFNFPTPPPPTSTSLPMPPTPAPATTPDIMPRASSAAPYNPLSDSSTSSTNVNGVKLLPDQMSKAQKYCKWAGSALNYDDVPEAISNLQKALKLLTTGQDS